MTIKKSPRTRPLLAFALALGMTTASSACLVGEDGQLAPEEEEKSLEDHVDGNYIVVLRSDAGQAASLIADDVRLETDLEIERAFDVINAYTFRGTAEEAAQVSLRPEVAYIEPDRIMALGVPGYCEWVPDLPQCQEDEDGDDPAGPERPAFCEYVPDHPLCSDGDDTPSAQTTPWGVTRVGGNLGASSYTAWVIDTGVDLDNDDLNLDLGRTRNFVSTETTSDDLHGHGTHVAGTIAAIDNDRAVIGVAAGTTVVGVRALGKDGSGALSDIIAAIDYVGQNGNPGDVANMSLGAKGRSSAMEDAIRRAADRGILFAVAAGNDGADASNTTPAALDYPNVYTVSAIDDTDCLASFSNYGAPVDVAAPGVDVVSLAAGGGTRSLNGTSMATPHVAGLLLHNSLGSDGTVRCDKDATPEPIAHQ